MANLTPSPLDKDQSRKYRSLTHRLKPQSQPRTPSFAFTAFDPSNPHLTDPSHLANSQIDPTLWNQNRKKNYLSHTRTTFEPLSPPQTLVKKPYGFSTQTPGPYQNPKREQKPKKNLLTVAHSPDQIHTLRPPVQTTLTDLQNTSNSPLGEEPSAKNQQGKTRKKILFFRGLRISIYDPRCIFERNEAPIQKEGVLISRIAPSSVKNLAGARRPPAEATAATVTGNRQPRESEKGSLSRSLKK